jgi:hypothetical protein
MSEDDRSETYRFCPGCGKDRVPGASFCSGCGRSLARERDTASSTQGQSPPPPPSPSPDRMIPPAQAPPPSQDIPPITDSTYGASTGYRVASNYQSPAGTTNGTAIAALIFAFLFWPVGIILGHIARSTIRRTGERGEGLALAALIISYIWGAVVIIVIIVAVAGSGSSSGFNNLSTLESAVTQQVDAKGLSVKSTICVHNSGTQYACDVTLSDGTSQSVSITVSSDGSRWVSN